MCIATECMHLSLQDYPKVSQSYYGLLEVLTQDHMDFISSLEPEVFIYILSSISEGLTGLGEQQASVVYCICCNRNSGQRKEVC